MRLVVFWYSLDSKYLVCVYLKKHSLAAFSCNYGWIGLQTVNYKPILKDLQTGTNIVDKDKQFHFI